MNEMGRGGLTYRLSTRIVDKDEVWVPPLQETVPPANAGSDHLPCERYKAVTRLEDFDFLQIERVSTRDTNSDVGTVTYASACKGDSITLLVLHPSNAI